MANKYEVTRKTLEDMLILISKRKDSNKLFSNIFREAVDLYRRDFLEGKIDAFTLYEDYRENLPIISNAALIVAIKNGFCLADVDHNLENQSELRNKNEKI